MRGFWTKFGRRVIRMGTQTFRKRRVVRSRARIAAGTAVVAGTGLASVAAMCEGDGAESSGWTRKEVGKVVKSGVAIGVGFTLFSVLPLAVIPYGAALALLGTRNSEKNRLKRWKLGWAAGRKGFHMSSVNENLKVNLDDFIGSDAKASSGARVLVPLCGKTRDMPFLASLGCQVVGVEGVTQAIDELDADLRSLDGAALSSPVKGDSFVTRSADIGSGTLTVQQGDFFKLDQAEAKGSFQYCYDRASLVAIEPSDRKKYAAVCADMLQEGGKILLVTLEHDPFNKGRLGPPYTVSESDVRRLYSEKFDIETVSRKNLYENEPKWKTLGVSYMYENVFILTRRRFI